MNVRLPLGVMIAAWSTVAHATAPENMRDLPPAKAKLSSEKHVAWQPLGDGFSPTATPGLNVRVRIGGTMKSEWLGKETTDYTMWPEFQNSGSVPIRLHLDKTRAYYQTARRDRLGDADGSAPFESTLQGDKNRTVLLPPGDDRGFTHVVLHFETFCDDCVDPRPAMFRMVYWASVDDRDAMWAAAMAQARQLQSQGQFKQAIELLWQASLDFNYKKDSNGEQLFDDLKTQLEQQNQANAAAAAAAAARAEADKLIASGDAKRGRGDLQGALRDYQAAKGKDPTSDADGRIAAVKKDIADAEAAKQAQADQKKAVADAKAAISAGRLDDAQWLIGVARDKGADGATISQLESDLSAAQEESAFASAVASGDMRKSQGDLQGAIGAWEQALSIRDDAGVRGKIEQAKSDLAAKAEAPDEGDPEETQQQAQNAQQGAAPDDQAWRGPAQEGVALLRQGDNEGAIAKFEQAKSMGGTDPQLDAAIETAQARMADQARFEEIEAQNEQARQDWEDRQAAAQQQAQERNEASLRQAEQRAAAATVRAERQLAMVDSGAAFMERRVEQWANNSQLREMARDASSLNMSLGDPAAMLADYREKIQILEDVARQKKEEFQIAMDDLQQTLAEMLSQLESKVQAAGQLGAVAVRIAGDAEIERKKNNMETKLRNELHGYFDQAKNELIADNQSGLNQFTSAEAKALTWSQQTAYQASAGFYACNIQQINANYSYDHTGWAETSCQQPSGSASGSASGSSAKERVALGRYKLERARQGGPQASAWLEAASVLADGAAAKDRNLAGAWALKAELSTDWIDRVAWYQRAADLSSGDTWEAEVQETIPQFSAAFFAALYGGDAGFLDRSAAAGVHMLVKSPDGRSPVLAGVDRNDHAVMKTLFRIYELDAGKDGSALLHLASGKNAAESARALVDLGVKPHVPDPKGRTPYYVAVASGAAATQQYLRQFTPNHLTLMKLADKLDEQGTADTLGVLGLEAAIAIQDTPSADGFLRARPALVDHGRGTGHTYTSWAAAGGDRRWLKLFLDRGASPDAADLRGDPILVLAVAGNHKDAADLLLSRDAKVNAPRATTGETALHHAVGLDVAWVGRLLSAGALVDKVDHSKRTAVHTAVAAGRADAVDRLLRELPNLTLQDTAGDTPLHIALAGGNAALADKLLPTSFAIDAQNGQGRAPLHLTVAGRMTAQTDALLGRAARVDLQDGQGDAPLHLALRLTDSALAGRLMDLGAPIAMANTAGEQALHLAAGGADMVNTTRLLGAGQSVGMVTGRGETPLHYAAKVGSQEVALYLLQNGADNKAKDNQKWNAGKAAKKAGHKDCAKLIAKYKPPKEPKTKNR